MSNAAALKIALDIIHVPSRVRIVRLGPLPDGVLLVLRIAAGEELAAARAAEELGRSRQVVSRAASFFIEQILLDPDADSYRVLGASRQATARELRRNMALILRCLHPDINRRAERSIFVGRVTRAWEDLKTPPRRAAYDLAQREKDEATSPRRTKKRTPWHSQGRLSSNTHSRGIPNANTSRPKKTHGNRQNQRQGFLRGALLLLLGTVRH